MVMKMTPLARGVSLLPEVFFMMGVSTLFVLNDWSLCQSFDRLCLNGGDSYGVDDIGYGTAS